MKHDDCVYNIIFVPNKYILASLNCRIIYIMLNTIRPNQTFGPELNEGIEQFLLLPGILSWLSLLASDYRWAIIQLYIFLLL